MRLGVLGAGQLGRMLALAAYPLGLHVRFLDPAPDACAAPVGEHIIADYKDQAALERFAQGLDVVTYEFENVPVATAEQLAQYVAVFPPPRALAVAQDRLCEKEFLTGLGVSCPRFHPVDSLPDLREAVRDVGLPAVLKTRRLGYDGKGQTVIRTEEELSSACEVLGPVPLILEALVPFDRELSVIVVRGRDGEFRAYPLIENHHRDGILHKSIAPAARIAAELQARGEQAAREVVEALDYVGVLTIEFFQVGNQLLANEIAPRVHNSGHWTIEGAETSQFENHVRAVAGLPLGSTKPRGCSTMFNLLGTVPAPSQVLSIEGAHLHLYGKEPREGRKLGHVTLTAGSEDRLEREVQALVARSEQPSG